MYPSFFDELEQIKATHLEKRAIDPVSLLTAGAVSHFGTNLAVRASHGTQMMRNFRSDKLSEGLRRGIAGEGPTVSSRFRDLWLGPELGQNEQLGSMLGGQMRDVSVGHRYRGLKKLRKAIAIPELQHTPVFEDVVGGVNKALAKPLPRAAPIQAPTAMDRVDKASPYAGIPGLAATEPAAMIHGGINRLRTYLAGSPVGQRWMRRGAQKGFQQGTGMDMHVQHLGDQVKNNVIDTAVSPAARDAEKMGRTFGGLTTSTGGSDKLRRILGAAHTAVGADKAKQLVDRITHQPGLGATIASTAASSKLPRSAIPAPAPEAPGAGIARLRERLQARRAAPGPQNNSPMPLPDRWAFGSMPRTPLVPGGG